MLDDIESRKQKITEKVNDIMLSINTHYGNKTPFNDEWNVFKEGINTAPEYFWTCPSSTSGKYHPADEFCEGGLALHTYRCIILGEEMIRGLDNDELDSMAFRYDTTVPSVLKSFIVALALHDIYACGMPGQLAYTDDGKLKTNSLHMLYVRPMLTGECEDMLSFNCIMIMIEGHYGPWSPNPQVKPDDMLSRMVYYIDYIASRNFVHIDIGD